VPDHLEFSIVRLTAGGNSETAVILNTRDSCHLRHHVQAYDCEAGADWGGTRDTCPMKLSRAGSRKDVMKVLFLCILVVVTIVNIMDYLAI